ncbi:Fe-S cluster protein [Nanoarchaeota archaeon]|mgnify:FL=1|nr:MAG: Fe-S cluster protein [Nanoarchaeota archaeon]
MDYEDRILDHYKNPRNYGKIKGGISGTAGDLLCGDVVTIYLKVEGNRVKDVKFEGEGCAISMASASILTELIKGKSLDFLKKMKEKDFLDEVKVVRTRVSCALVGFRAMKNALKSLDA